MVKYLALSIALAAVMSTDIAASVRTEYTKATEQEQTVRVALADPSASVAVLKNVRRTIAAYEGVVRRHPISSYSDDALWNGARLALDAFERFGEVRDRETGLRLLRLLASEYPSSKRAKQVPELLARQHKEQGATPAPRPARVEARPASPPVTTPSAAETKASAVEPPRAATPTPLAGTGITSVSSVPPSPPAPVAASAVSTGQPATISAIRRAVLPDVIRVTIALDAEVPYHEERIDGPSRIFVDFPFTRTTSTLTDRTLRFDDDTDVVRHVRIGRHPNATTRIVLDATGVSSYSVYPIYNPYRLVIDCLRATSTAKPPQLAAVVSPIPARPLRLRPETAVKDVKPPAIELPPAVPPRLASHRLSPVFARALPDAGPLATGWLIAAYVPPLPTRVVGSLFAGTLPATLPAATARIGDALTPAPPAPVSIPSSSSVQPTAVGPVTPPAAPSNLSMARQLGLGVSRIVIDPGHGGHDPGAKGKGGITEAELVLDVSLRLQKLLEKQQGVEVILTRQIDCFVPLQERTAIANREGADLFLSIHANASANDQAHGVETYFLNFANNLGAASVAARENAASGQAMAALPDFVKAIALNNKVDESRKFAGIVQTSMVDHLQGTNKPVKNLGVKQAPFLVLIGASMPSVLAEISFVTNPQEARLLKNNAYRQKIAESLFEAIKQYQTSLTRTQAVSVH